MASSVLVRPFHLAVIGLGLPCLLLLAGAATGTEPLHASVLPHDDRTLTLAGRPASSSTSASTTLPDDAAPRLLDVSAAAREDVFTAPATTAASAPPACSSCPCVRVVVDMREAAVEDVFLQPGGATAAATRKALLLHALPLLAVPFLPTPLAAVVALSALATPIRAGHLSTNGTCTRGDREHATCTVYRYLPDGCVDRVLPFAGLRKVCNAGSDELARSMACACRSDLVGDPIQRYCHVRTLELSEGPEGLDWCVLPGHLPPIANPGAAAASGEDVCYVELEHGDHREGYYILCPVLNCPRFPFLCCPELPHGGAAAVVAAA